jgi:hypothetical protein
MPPYRTGSSFTTLEPDRAEANFFVDDIKIIMEACAGIRLDKRFSRRLGV